MIDPTSFSEKKKPVVTTKGTIATHSLADMRRVFQYIGNEDFVALDKLILSGRAFHLPKGIRVHVLDSSSQQEGMCKLRIRGSITEIWASLRSITE